ncbi:MAG: hypothetical protein NT104_07440 [Bacteroidetes bacterium]|nr:hypothetical protein [Bacteroidota bacterium]
MYQLFFLFLALLFSKYNHAQKSFTAFVNVNSSQVQHENTGMVWSFGETIFTQTLVHPTGFIFTGGLLQPNSDRNIEVSTRMRNIKVGIGPNPVVDRIHIFCDELGILINSIQVADAFGQTKQVLKGPFSGVNFKIELPMLSANTGIYFIVIHYIVDDKFKKIKTYKIIKT